MVSKYRENVLKMSSEKYKKHLEYCKLAMRERRKNPEFKEKEKKYGREKARERRKIVIKILGDKCKRCGYDEFNESLQVHHINGDYTNHDVNNLIVLCSNCHRATSLELITKEEIIELKKKNKTVIPYVYEKR